MYKKCSVIINTFAVPLNINASSLCCVKWVWSCCVCTSLLLCEVSLTMLCLHQHFAVWSGSDCCVCFSILLCLMSLTVLCLHQHFAVWSGFDYAVFASAFCCVQWDWLCCVCISILLLKWVTMLCLHQQFFPFVSCLFTDCCTTWTCGTWRTWQPPTCPAACSDVSAWPWPLLADPRRSCWMSPPAVLILMLAKTSGTSSWRTDQVCWWMVLILDWLELDHSRNGYFFSTNPWKFWTLTKLFRFDHRG